MREKLVAWDRDFIAKTVKVTAKPWDLTGMVVLVTNKRRTLQWPARSMDLNPSKHVWNILKRNVPAQPLQPNLKELTRVTHQMCHSITVSSHIH